MFILKRNSIISNLCACSWEIMFSRHMSMKINPGANRRMKLIKTDKQEETDLEAMDYDYEADFENVNRTHREYVEEMERLREKHQFDIVKQKYFKAKYPNFLTWHDKKQLVLLHRRDPEEWNVMRLSEGFPALPEIIKKIIKSNWTKDSVAKIKRHDAVVQENWRKFKNNEFEDLPENLINHLKKFSDRCRNFHNYEEETDDKLTFKVISKPGEFSEIISSYEKLKNKNKNTEETNNINISLISKQQKLKNNQEEDTYVEGIIKNKNPITLDALKQKLESEIRKGKNVPETDLPIIEIQKEENTMEKRITNELDTMKYNTGKIIVADDKKVADYNHLIYPERISIPKKICKKGYTYKLNDCYYDSDGRFLYRVPGMY